MYLFDGMDGTHKCRVCVAQCTHEIFRAIRWLSMIRLGKLFANYGGMLCVKAMIHCRLWLAVDRNDYCAEFIIKQIGHGLRPKFVSLLYFTVVGNDNSRLYLSAFDTHRTWGHGTNVCLATHHGINSCQNCQWFNFIERRINVSIDPPIWKGFDQQFWWNSVKPFEIGSWGRAAGGWHRCVITMKWRLTLSWSR